MRWTGAVAGALVAAVAVGAVVGAIPERVAGLPDGPAGRFADPVPRADGSTLVWAVGDGATWGAPGRALARRIQAERPGAFLYLGDVYETGTAAEFARLYTPVYGALRPVTLPTPGNHEWPSHALGYDPYWAAVIGGRPPWRYAVGASGWRIISVNSETPADPAQVRWLRGRLAGAGTCRLVFWHRPRFSAGEHGDAPAVAPLWREVAGRAALVLNGHEHATMVMRPREGVTAVVAGAGGREFHRVDRADPRLAFADDRRRAGVRLVLRPGRAHLAVVGEDGRVLHRRVVRCQSSPSSAS